MNTQRNISIIQVVTTPFSKRDEARHFIPEMQAQGYAVRVFDLSMVYFGCSEAERDAFPDALSSDYVRKISSLEALRAELDQLKASTVLTILWTAERQDAIDAYMDAIECASARIIVFNSGSPIPVPSDDRMYSWRMRMKRKAYALLDPARIRQKLRTVTGASAAAAPRPPLRTDGVLYSCRTRLRLYEMTYGDDLPWMVPTHVHDQDLFRSVPAANDAEPGCCVYLHQNMLPSHMYQIKNRAPLIDVEKHAESMNRLFGRIERELGLEVVIALHPRVKDVPKAYSGRSLVYGETHILARRAKLFVAHASTAVNYAVLASVPVVFAVTRQMLDPTKSGFYMRVDSMAKALGQSVVNIDDKAAFDDFDLSALKVDAPKYEAYFADYISADGRDGPSRAETLLKMIGALIDQTAGDARMAL